MVATYVAMSLTRILHMDATCTNLQIISLSWNDDVVKICHVLTFDWGRATSLSLVNCVNLRYQNSTWYDNNNMILDVFKIYG